VVANVVVNVVANVVETEEAVLLHTTPLGETTTIVLTEVMVATVATVVAAIMLLMEVTEATEVIEVTEATEVIVAVVGTDLDRLLVEAPLLQNTVVREAVALHLVRIDDLKRDKELTRVNLSLFIFRS